MCHAEAAEEIQAGVDIAQEIIIEDAGQTSLLDCDSLLLILINALNSPFREAVQLIVAQGRSTILSDARV